MRIVLPVVLTLSFGHLLCAEPSEDRQCLEFVQALYAMERSHYIKRWMHVLEEFAEKANKENVGVSLPHEIQYLVDFRATEAIPILLQMVGKVDPNRGMPIQMFVPIDRMVPPKATPADYLVKIGRDVVPVLLQGIQDSKLDEKHWPELGYLLIRIEGADLAVAEIDIAAKSANDAGKANLAVLKDNVQQSARQAEEGRKFMEEQRKK